ncbi:hypothetical protein QA601_02920 [Chitinispirillales bacterium ANBcel5]|uniref:hypothetical protein n=1 Tax=Cellulosispirillum alkaliphilum TaxID=3039283 RepID=UPI002A582843|nr:hypothetical protein [Chitinispirillales bacterium ANBcel5]
MANQSTPYGGLTPQRVPEAYIRAEIASLPLASEVSFRMAITELNPLLDRKKGKKTSALWRKCEVLLSEHASGWSLDRLVAIRDFFWFDYDPNNFKVDQPNPLHNYLRCLAKRYVCNRPGVSEVTNNENFFDATSHYRWLIFALPEDLLLISSKTEPPPTYVDIDPPLFIRCIHDKGVSEIHQHIGASMDFKTLWMSALAALASPDVNPGSIIDPEMPFKNSDLFFRWLLAAAIARSLLMEYLVSGNKTYPLADFIRELRGIRGQLWQTLQQVVLALQHGEDELLPDEIFPLRMLYQEVHPYGYEAWKKPPETLEEAWKKCDPIAARLSLSSPNEAEARFVRRCLAFMEDPGRKPDELFITLFWQVIRLRNLLYRSVVQRPMTAGLQWFIRFSDRLKPFRKPLRKIRTEISYEVACGIAKGSVVALEIRSTAKDTPEELAQDLCELTESWEHVVQKYSSLSSRNLEFGVLLLFAKARDQEKRWGHGDPPAYGSETHSEPLPSFTKEVQLGRRYELFFADLKKKVMAAKDLIWEKPTILWLLRGIDVAADELSIPTWVLVPLFNFLERESAFAAASVHDPIKPKSLRITAHVGEDFRHLMEGMRRIFETVHYLLRRSGGRIGHATALGYDPRQWAEQTGSVMMPKEERLWDLVFEWRLYTAFETPYELRIDVPPQRIGYLENQIRSLSRDVFGEEQMPHIMALVHHTLHTLWSGPEVNVHQPEVCLESFDLALKSLNTEFYYKNKDASKLIELYRTNELVFRRGQQLENVTIDHSEISALFAVQDALRRLVSIRGIVAEVNPSSNLLIGNLMDLRNHPTLRLFPPEPQEGAPPPVRIAIGSDDPIIFSTHLMREYSLLHNAAISAGYSEHSVGAWLETIRCTSMDARFTTAWPCFGGKNMGDSLLEELGDFLHRPKDYRKFKNMGKRRRDGC